MAFYTDTSLSHSGMARVWVNKFTSDPHVYSQMEWAFASQPQICAAVWLVLISRCAEGRRLSWPGWLSEIRRRFAFPKTVRLYSINRGRWELNSWPSSRKANAIATRLRSHLCLVLYRCWHAGRSCWADLLSAVRRMSEAWPVVGISPLRFLQMSCFHIIVQTHTGLESSV